MRALKTEGERLVKSKTTIVQGETIAAIATAIVPQQGSVGIVRLSGATAGAIAQQLFQTTGQWESHDHIHSDAREPSDK